MSEIILRPGVLRKRWYMSSTEEQIACPCFQSAFFVRIKDFCISFAPKQLSEGLIEKHVRQVVKGKLEEFCLTAQEDFIVTAPSQAYIHYFPCGVRAITQSESKLETAKVFWELISSISAHELLRCVDEGELIRGWELEEFFWAFFPQIAVHILECRHAERWLLNFLNDCVKVMVGWLQPSDRVG